MKCTNCSKTIYGKIDVRSNNHFCSLSCSASYNNRKRRLTDIWKDKISSALRCQDMHRICQYCGTEYRRTTVNQKFCSKKCANKSRRKYLDIPDCLENADRKLDKNLGYVRVYAPMHPEANTWGYVYEHRLIAEQMIGRRLNDNEVVHHKNGKRWDNSPNNLKVMDKREHCSLSAGKA